MVRCFTRSGYNHDFSGMTANAQALAAFRHFPAALPALRNLVFEDPFDDNPRHLTTDDIPVNLARPLRRAVSVLAACTALEVLFIKHASERAVIAASLALPRLCCLQRLRVSPRLHASEEEMARGHCPGVHGATAAVALAAALRPLTALTYLDLQSIAVTRYGGAALVDAMYSLSQLRDLRRPHVGGPCMAPGAFLLNKSYGKPAAQSAAPPPALTRLHLGHRNLLSKAECQLMQSAWTPQRLRRLSLCGLQGVGAADVAAALRPLAGGALTWVTLRDCALDADLAAAAALGAALAALPHLASLDCASVLAVKSESSGSTDHNAADLQPPAALVSQLNGALLPPLAACTALCTLRVCLTVRSHMHARRREQDSVSLATAEAQLSPLSALTTLTSLNIYLSDVHGSIVRDSVLPQLPALDDKHCITSRF